MSLTISSVKQTDYNRFDVTVIYTPSDKLLQLDGKDYFFNIAALDRDDAKRKAIVQMGIKLQGDIKVNKVTNKQILDKAHTRYLLNEEILIKARETLDYSDVQMCRGIFWGRDKEIGNLYHAYCEFCGDLFEDAWQYKKDCEKLGRKRGWIIGNTKETRDIAVCPICKEKLKLEIANEH